MPWLQSKHRLDCGDAAERLEFPELLVELAGRVRFERSAEALIQLQPLAEQEAIEARRLRVDDWIRLAEHGVEPDLTGLLDLGEALEPCRREGESLSGEDLHLLSLCLFALSRFGAFLTENRELAPSLMADWGNPPELASLAGEIERCVDEEGQLRDDASPALGRVRRQIRETRGRVRASLDGLIHERLVGGERDLRPRIRSGRLVLPVKREQRGELPGIVHDESASGKTLFVEPLETVELNNRVTSLMAEEGKECARILLALTARVAAWVDAIRGQLDVFQHLELPRAAASLARERSWCWAEWSSAEEDRIRLKSANHPLLARYLPAGTAPVPLDLELDSTLRLLLVTGPNTGGKTVLLKTLGLLVLMNQCGLPIPAAEGSRLPLFARLHADIGDEQSLAGSHSTFSAHLARLGAMAEAAAPGTLILVDEIGDGTDPEEGAALAQALMNHWIEKRARAIVSTHFGVLKGYAQERPGAANAAMDFDPVARRPLYTVSFGVPGSSRALATARRLGMDAGVLAEAEQLLGEEALSLEALLERLERETGEATRLREEAQTLRERYERLENDYAERIARVRKEEREILREGRREALDFLAKARSDFERSVRDMKEQDASRESIRAGRAGLEQLARELSAQEAALAERREAESIGDWRAGDRVRLRATGQSAEILEEAGNGRLRVSLRGMPMVLPIEELIPAPGGDNATESTGRRESFDGVNYDAVEMDSYRLDLRGFTAEETRERLDDFLDGAQLASCEFIELLHGKGGGVLREEVRRFLSRDSRVSRFDLADQNRGGSGVTVAWLRGEGSRS